MSILLSALLKEMSLLDAVTIINEKEFDAFSRITSELNLKKCIFISSKKYVKSIDSTVSMIITSPEVMAEIPKADYGFCVTDSPRDLFFEVMSRYEKKNYAARNDTIIGRNCSISDTAKIASKGVVIGNNVIIGDYVVIHEGTTIGDNVTIQTSARIGEQDFNLYAFQGHPKQLYHSGRVQIGSNVLISSGVLVGRALYSYGVTAIGDNCFIGANVGIGHNSIIEDNCEICANTALGGYCEIGRNSKLYMSVTVANALKIGANATINVGSVVIRNVKEGKTLFGNPAREIVSPKA